MGSLADKADPAIKKLSALGVTFDEVNPLTNSLADVIEVLENANIDAGQAISIFGKEAGPKLIPLLNAGKAGYEKYTEAVTGTNAAMVAVAIQNDTLKGRMDQLRSTTEATSIQIGKSLEPALSVVAGALKGLIDLIGKVPTGLLGIGTAAALGAGGVAALGFALNALGVSLTVSLGPLAIAAGILGAVVAGVSSDLKKIRERKDNKLVEEFKDVEEAAGLTGKQIRGLQKDFKKAETTFEGVGRGVRKVGNSTADLTEKVIALAEANGKSVEEILKIVEADEKQIKSIHAQIKATKELTAQKNALIEAAKRQYVFGSGLTKKEIAEWDKRLDKARELRKEEAARIKTQEAEAVAQEKKAKALQQVEEREEVRLAGIEALTIAENKYRDGRITEGEFQKVQLQILDSTIEAYYDLGHALDAVNADGSLTEGAKLIKATLEQKDAIKAVAEENDNLVDIVVEGNKVMTLSSQEWTEIALDGATDLADSIVALSRAVTKNQIEEYDKQLEAVAERYDAERQIKLDALDLEEQEALDRAGVAEETKLERLERERNAAIKSGNQLLAEEKRKAIEREKIQSEFQAKREKAESGSKALELKETEALERKKAELEYRARNAQWVLQLASAYASIPLAILNVMESTPAPSWPVTIPLASGLATINTAIVAASKPKKPEFQTGGIVLPSSGGADIRVAENGHSETLFNSGPTGQAFTKQMGGYIADEIIAKVTQGRQTALPARQEMKIQVILDGQVIAESSAEYYNNGNVRLEVGT